eukprot:m.141313 g.141313  ORF g.141313 m.141313 type:complete len:230 (-) comp17669_c0_seq3:236-925(-)
MDPIELMKLIALLLCVPTQLWLSQTTAPANNGRVGERIDWKGGGHGLMDIEGRFQNGIHMLGAPYRLYKRIMHIEKNDYGPKLQPSGAQPKSPAVEVIKASYFAASRRIRRDRRKLSYRVGQVFVHKKHGYKGLIIGWDSAARAPAAWFKDNHVSVKQRQQPWYAVLVDSGDRDEVFLLWLRHACLLSWTCSIRHVSRCARAGIQQNVRDGGEHTDCVGSSRGPGVSPQ